MKMHKLLLTFIIALFFSSCGVISKTRYGNGFKINVNWGKDSEKKISTKPFKDKKKSTQNIEQTPNITEVLTDITTEYSPTFVTLPTVKKENIIAHSFENQLPKKPIIEKIEKKKAIIKSYIKPNQPKLKNDERPFEKNALWGGILFYGGILLGILVPLISTITTIIGLVLSIIGMGNIKRSGYLFKGYGLALSVVIVFLLSLLYVLFILALLLAII